MVVFTCNNCGDSLQKPKVAKHYQFQCRNSISLTCVDCFKDFLGDEYVVHTKCITEAERYGTKDYVAKPSANKGERKQQEWIKIVTSIINGANNLTKDEQNILQYISKHENIPRKKVKFINFVKSSMGYRVNANAVESCWTKIEAAFNEMTKNKNSNDTKTIEKNIDDTVDNLKNNEKNEQVGKSSKKRKCDELNIDEIDIEQPNTKLNGNRPQSTNDRSTDKQQIQEQNANIEPKLNFDWESCILNVLKKKDGMSLKKLEKKVVAKCLKFSDKLSNEKVLKRFHKKLSKMSTISLNDGIVNLVH